MEEEAKFCPPATFNKTNCSSKHKQWTEQQMLAAITMAENGEVSANQAADVHGVPCSNIERQTEGRSYSWKETWTTSLPLPWPDRSLLKIDYWRPDKTNSRDQQSITKDCS